MAAPVGAPARRDRELVRAAQRRLEVGVDAGAAQIAVGLVDRPVEEEHAARGEDHRLVGAPPLPPRRHVLRVRRVEVVDAGDERGDAGAQLGTQRREAALRHLVVIEHARALVDLDALLTHRARVLADPHQQIEEELLGAILGLRPAHRVEAALDGGRVDVRDAPGVAVEHDLAGVVALAG